MLHDLLEIAIVVFAVSSMLAVGLTYTLREIVGPLAHLRLVALALVANFLLVPALALVITWGLDLDERYALGLVLVATAAGSAFLVKLVVLSDGDVAFAASLLVLLMPATVLYMPVVVPLISPDADVDAFAIASPWCSPTFCHWRWESASSPSHQLRHRRSDRSSVRFPAPRYWQSRH